MEEIVKRVKAAGGGPSKLARALGGITPQAIVQWKRIPVERVVDLEAITGIPREEMRPDIFRPRPS